jgi:hypothetical protein
MVIHEEKQAGAEEEEVCHGGVTGWGRSLTALSVCT